VVALPIALALIAQTEPIAKLFRRSPAASKALTEGVSIHRSDISGGVHGQVSGDVVHGDQISNEVAFIALTVVESTAAKTASLTPAHEKLLQDAANAIERGDYARAVPLLETIAETTPSAAVLNNLAAAQLALGERAPAARVLERIAGHTGPADPAVSAALRFNRCQLAATASVRPAAALTPMHSTKWPGIVAYVTRFEVTEGAITLEVKYRNTAEAQVRLCPYHGSSSLLDEGSRERIGIWVNSDHSCEVLSPAAESQEWVKFALPEAVRPHYTVDLYGLERPFERVPLSGGLKRPRSSDQIAATPNDSGARRLAPSTRNTRSTTMTDTITGGCLCGAVRYECSAELSKIIACHCTDCQKASGAGASHNVVAPSEAVKVVEGQPKVFEKRVDSGRLLKRFFCGDCGSPLFTQRENAPQMMVIKVGSLDDPGALEMGMHIWVRSQRPWMDRDDSLPSFAENRPA
jgi:hypothetical protein